MDKNGSKARQKIGLRSEANRSEFRLSAVKKDWDKKLGNVADSKTCNIYFTEKITHSYIN